MGMRQSSARWWEIPGERYEREIAESFSRDYGISVRYLHHATPADVRFEVHAEWFSTHCEACGVPLMGGATRHTLACPFRKLIEDAFPAYKCPSP